MSFQASAVVNVSSEGPILTTGPYRFRSWATSRAKVPRMRVDTYKKRARISMQGMQKAVIKCRGDYVSIDPARDRVIALLIA